MNRKGFAPIIILFIVAVVLIGVGGIYYYELRKSQSLEIQAETIQEESCTLDANGLPPDPGLLGQQTLAGIDCDHDGIRDDIERWIAFNDASSPRIKMALTQEAEGIQEAIVSSTDKQAGMAGIIQESNGGICLDGIMNDALAGGALSDKLDSVAINTSARADAYFRSNSYMNGTATTLPPLSQWTSLCAFNPDSLPN